MIGHVVRPKKYMCCSFFVMFLLKSSLPIFFKFASLALGQSQDCPSASEAIQNKMGE